MTRQNYYKCRSKRKKEKINTNLITDLVKYERKIQPRLGGKKVLRLIKDELDKAGVSIGRDRFFNMLRENDMLVARKKSKPKTTNSKHCLPVFHNLLNDVAITSSNQVWASDITYVRTEEGFMYASIITDMYSRKIVGTYIGDSLERYGCIAALEKALADLPADKAPIHHSDRGCQYCCHEYVRKLQSNNMQISMTEINHCYENALSERVNGILKQEYELDMTFRTKKQAQTAFYQAVDLYNYRRPHLSLNYRFPGEVHEEAA